MVRLTVDLSTFLVVFGLSIVNEMVVSTNVTRSTILVDIFKGYDKKLPPKYNHSVGDQQVHVNVTLFINSMYSISEANMDYSMSMFLRERWTDERLMYDNVLNLSRLELDVSSIDDVWKPDMYILNEKSSRFHDVTVPNRLMHIYPDGTVQYSMRVTGAFSCLMFLQKYPFDTQECHFEVESYGHSTETIKFEWAEGNAVSIADGIQFPQFELINVLPYECNKDYYGIIYPCIGAKFTLKRNYAYYITQIYIPSMMIVVLSWVNFWLDPNSVPARISLALLTVLTMTTQSSGARANLPRVSYVKAIDIWMAVCLAFVFMGLIEFALVNVKGRFVQKRKSSVYKKTDDNENSNDKSACQNQFQEAAEDGPSKNSICQLFRDNPSVAIDKTSRWLFPLLFILFNVFYWIFYFHWEPDITIEKTF